MSPIVQQKMGVVGVRRARADPRAQVFVSPLV
jgi:hypothetical protein